MKTDATTDVKTDVKREHKSLDLAEAKRAYARTLRSALCLSGGGIRSATFNLGILQGLARHGLLEQFDYLSTVSGGGFIGGWLTAWMHRRGTEGVIKELTAPPTSPVEPEPHPINHLRVFSNYLSPRPGLLSADTWTLGSTLLRNLLLTWLVFVPFLALALLAPRAWLSIVSPQMAATSLAQSPPTGFDQFLLYGSFALGMIGAWVALSYVGIALASKKPDEPPADLDPYQNRDSTFIYWCLLPGVASAAAFAFYWARLSQSPGGQIPTNYLWLYFVAFAIALVLVPWLVTFSVRTVPELKWIADRTERGNVGLFLKNSFGILLNFIVATVLIAVAQLVAGTILYAVWSEIFLHPKNCPALYATLSVPIMLASLLLGCALIAGLTSTLTKDQELEWWARAGAWFMIVVVGWLALHLLVLYGPSVIVDFGSLLRNSSGGGGGGGQSLISILTVAGGVISGVVTLLGSFSGRTPASGEEARRASAGARLLGWLTNLLAPVFFAFLLILIALGTNWLLFAVGRLLLVIGGLPDSFYACLASPHASVPKYLNWLFDALFRFLLPISSTNLLNWLSKFNSSEYADFVVQTPLLLILLSGVLVALVGLVVGILVNTNKFSLHFMWRDRIIRAYLGASRDPLKRNPQPFTNFDTDDNLYMCELREQPHEIGLPEVLVNARDSIKEEFDRSQNEIAPRRKLFHVLNIALNLAGGDKLAWQDRKAESFTVSPLHAGSYWLGYRRTRAYGGDDGGISLGTAIAISGAFVSPNMGYMMSSPVVRFLMTLFNVRFGWWLGNPGAAGDDTDLIETWIGWVRNKIGYVRRRGKPFEAASPLLSVFPITAEAFGQTNDKSSYVYLSDGGHFENLGLYEMVLRRCRFIVVCDASTDANYSFDSLAQSIRQIRVDLGVPIEMRDMSISPPSQGLRGKYCSVGTIRYSCVDRKAHDDDHKGLEDGDFDGTLIYIKASMIGEEPRDVLNYGRGSETFPQEVIVDQWFSEAQFESYRALGSHIVDVICSGDAREVSDQNRVSLAAFERKAREHNRLNLRAFREQMDYAALDAQFRRAMRANPRDQFRRRVGEFVDDLLGK